MIDPPPVTVAEYEAAREADIVRRCREVCLHGQDGRPRKPRLGRWSPVFCEDGRWWRNGVVAARALGCTPSNVNNAVNGWTETCKGWRLSREPFWIRAKGRRLEYREPGRSTP